MEYGKSKIHTIATLLFQITKLDNYFILVLNDLK